MDIEKINKRHKLETDMYYRIEMGLSSKLIDYSNGIFHIEVVLGRRWRKNYNAAAAEIAYCWREANQELKHAIGCKVYIIDTNRHPYKNYLIAQKIDVEYDAKKGVLFNRHHLN